MADRLTRIRPGPRDCPLGGVPFPVHEARLCDLMALQAWVDARWPDPAGDLDAALDGLAGVERDRVLLKAYEAIDDGPPHFDDERGVGVMFGSPGGYAEFLRVALTRGTPGMTGDDLCQLAHSVESGETMPWFRSVQKAFYGSDPLYRVAAELGLIEDRPSGVNLTWGESVDELARSHGWTYETIYGLTVSEFLNARRGGKPNEYRLSPAATAKFLERRAAALGEEPPRAEEVSESVWAEGW